MLSLKITNMAVFTNMLFSENVFDRFLLHDLSLNTALSVTMDGRKNPEFYEESEQEEALADPYVTWESVRLPIRSLILGKKLPVSFKIVMVTAKNTTENMVRRAGFTGCPVSSLSLTILFREKQLYLTTGVSYLGLSLDRSLEKHWDQTVRSFLEDKNCAFEDL